MNAVPSVGWSPSVYLQFEDERTRPARDLLAQVRLADPRVVVDVGCGPGNSTELLAADFPDSDIVGFDTSEAMLAEARQRVPSARFEIADAAGRWHARHDGDPLRWWSARYTCIATLGNLTMLALRLPPDLEKRLEALAAKTGRTKSYYAGEAILEKIEDLEDYYLAEERLRTDSGERIGWEEVKARVFGDDDEAAA